MDWKMPGMDGIEASRRILGHAAIKEVPDIIMVGDRDKALAAGRRSPWRHISTREPAPMPR
jgi:CheY-like chemotaxis protein